MKKFWGVAIVAMVGCLFPPGFSGEAAWGQTTDREKLAALTEGPFTLDDLPDDMPGTTRYKAALRLFAGVGAVRILCSECSNRSVWDRYEKRNGNTISLVVSRFKDGGGFGEQQRGAVNAHSRELAEKALRGANCDMLMSQVNRQDWDIYKGKRFSRDYKLVK
ncbi:MAG: hypothetical protein LBF41_06830 [Deltaproteobacteria bacterium]|jgi:hypothetical protein|nr:hypothetical protein [Deltaproteobacteria bacterium]